jgi:hypothetical protein
MVKMDDGVAPVVASVDERWWVDWATGDDQDDDEEVLEPTSLWEAEMSALDDEQLLALEESAEDG